MNERKNQDIGRIMQDDPERYEKAQAFGGRFTLLLAYGHIEAARRLVDEAEFEMQAAPEKFGNRSLTSIVPVRTANILELTFGALVVADLVNVSNKRFIEAPNVNWSTLDQLWHAVVRAAIKEKEDGR